MSIEEDISSRRVSNTFNMLNAKLPPKSWNGDYAKFPAFCMKVRTTLVTLQMVDLLDPEKSVAFCKKNSCLAMMAAAQLLEAIPPKMASVIPIAEQTNFYAIWNRLDQDFDRNRETICGDLRRNLANVKPISDDLKNVSNTILHLDNLYMQLNYMDQEYTDSMKIQKLSELCSMNARAHDVYADVMIQMRKDNKHKCYSEVCSELLNVAAYKAIHQSNSAYSVNATQKKKGKSSERKLNGIPKKYSRSDLPEDTCAYCKEKGHWRNKCPKIGQKETNEEENSTSERKFDFSKQKANTVEIVEDETKSEMKLRSQYHKSLMLDTGASIHTVGNTNVFIPGTMQESNEEIVLANHEKLKVKYKGQVKIALRSEDGSTFLFKITARYHPDLSNLFSTHAFVEELSDLKIKEITNLKWEAFTKRLKITMNKKDYVLKTLAVNGTYWLNNCIEVPKKLSIAKVTKARMQQWHNRLGHSSAERILHNEKLNKDLVIEGKRTLDQNCEACKEQKVVLKSHKGKVLPRSPPASTWHLDTVTITPTSRDGHNYLQVFVNYQRYTMVYPVRTRDSIDQVFKDFMIDAPVRPTHLISDQAPEFRSGKFRDIVRNERMQLKYSPTYDPKANGLVERRNGVVINDASTMLRFAGLPLNQWHVATQYSARISNHMITRRRTKSPVELTTGFPPDISQFYILGCRAYVTIPKERRVQSGKYNLKTVKGWFAGIAPSCTDRTYLVWDDNLNLMPPSREVTFDESLLYGDLHGDGGAVADLNDDVPDGDHSDEDDTSSIVVEDVTKLDMDDLDDESQDQREDMNERVVNVNPPSNRTEKSREENRAKARNIYDRLLKEATETRADHPTAYGDIDYQALERKAQAEARRGQAMTLRSATITGEDSLVEYLSSSIDDPSPKSFKDAMSRSDAEEWMQSIAKEVLVFFSRCIEWVPITEVPEGNTIMRSHMLFKVKIPSMVKKTRWVADGSTMDEDKFEKFAPVAARESIFTVLAISLALKIPVSVFDVSEAFTWGKAKPGTYMFHLIIWKIF